MSTRRIENLPFTAYDLISYLTPGIFILTFISFHPFLYDTFYLLEIMHGSNAAQQILQITIMFGVAYTLGVMLSFVSVAVSEKLVLRIIGHPKEYLFLNKEYLQRAEILACIKKNIIKTSRYNIITIIFLFTINAPMILALLIFHIMFSTSFYFKPLEKVVILKVKENLSPITGDNPVHLDTLKKWFSYIIIYTERKGDLAAHRSYNYVVKYGFLRSITTICTLYLWFIIISEFLMLISLKEQNIRHLISGSFLVDYIIFSALNVLAFLAYLKFFRRHSKTNVMNFAVKD